MRRRAGASECLSPTTRRSIDNALQRDRASFYSVADQVNAVARERRWDWCVIDANSAYFVARFLLSTLPTDVPMPGQLPIANSSEIAQDKVHPYKVRSLLAQRIGTDERALVVTDFVDSGNALSRITGKLAALEIETDVAVLTASTPPYWKGRQPAAQLYVGQISCEPAIYMAPGVNGGFQTIPSVPQPQIDPAVHPTIVEYFHGAIDTLAQEYRQNRVI